MADKQCMVCYLNMDQERQQGFMNSCSHKICSTCLIRWSKQSNVCPMCKQKFSEIRVYEVDGFINIPVPNRDLEDSENGESQPSAAIIEVNFSFRSHNTIQVIFMIEDTLSQDNRVIVNTSVDVRRSHRSRVSSSTRTHPYNTRSSVRRNNNNN